MIPKILHVVVQHRRAKRKTSPTQIISDVNIPIGNFPKEILNVK